MVLRALRGVVLVQVRETLFVMRALYQPKTFITLNNLNSKIKEKKLKNLTCVNTSTGFLSNTIAINFGSVFVDVDDDDVVVVVVAAAAVATAAAAAAGIILQKIQVAVAVVIANVA